MQSIDLLLAFSYDCSNSFVSLTAAYQKITATLRGAINE
jgi:hypothetical protein